MSLICIVSDEHYGRRDTPTFWRVGEMNIEEVKDRMVEVKKDIRVTISKQDIDVCLCWHSKNSGPRPIIEKFAGTGNQYSRFDKQKKLKNSYKI